MYNGIIIVNKDAGMSSHDVVYRLRKMTGQKKIGHMGTLDPQARGVLPVCLGSATRLSDFFLKAAKQYRAVMRLGVVSDTQDMTGQILRRSDDLPDAETIRGAVASFEGEISQIPPMYSAVKHRGKKLYELARKGVEVERKPRQVTISQIETERIDGDRVTMLITCSKGTYIRTLCADIGERLGCGACMEDLVRTKSGPFDISRARTLQELEGLWEQQTVLLPIDSFFAGFPGYKTVPEDDYLLWNGNPLLIQDMEKAMDGTNGAAGISLPPELSPDYTIRMYDSAGDFWGVYTISNKRKGLYRPFKMFPPR